MERSGSFAHDGHRLDYSVFGEGPRTTILLHGLLFSRRMHRPLAEALADRGHRVVTLDLLGHGTSDQPTDMAVYSMTAFAEQVVALIDHLDIEEAVVGGTSLGANVTLELADLAPGRLRGMVLEMPVLDGALVACALAFTPLMVGLRFGAAAFRGMAAAARLIPKDQLPFLPGILVDVAQRDPAPSAAILQGLFFGRIAPQRAARRRFRAPALVIGHPRDPIHPFADSGMLADELPEGRLLRAGSILEMRVAPERLTNEIAGFVDECWRPKAAAGRQRARVKR